MMRTVFLIVSVCVCLGFRQHVSSIMTTSPCNKPHNKKGITLITHVELYEPPNIRRLNTNNDLIGIVLYSQTETLSRPSSVTLFPNRLLTQCGEDFVKLYLHYADCWMCPFSVYLVVCAEVSAHICNNVLHASLNRNRTYGLIPPFLLNSPK